MTKYKEKLPKSAAGDIFILTFDRMRRYEGTWHLERQLMFPGYVFLESEDREVLSEKLESCGLTFRGRQSLFQVGRKEEEFLKRLCGAAHHLAMSRGVLHQGSPRITEGPLKGMEKRISRIDRHKRLARVEMMIRPDNHYIQAGLEITEKII